MFNIKLIAGMAVLVALSACTQPGQGQGIKANCALMGAGGGALLGAATDNNLAQSAIVGGIAGAAAGNAGLCN